tara:strand:- start:289 stop:786 length:498 start_codon:yes stop_codon:yes gene_type:complete
MVSVVDKRYYEVSVEDKRYYESIGEMGPHLFCPDTTPQFIFDRFAREKAEREALAKLRDHLDEDENPADFIAPVPTPPCVITSEDLFMQKFGPPSPSVADSLHSPSWEDSFPSWPADKRKRSDNAGEDSPKKKTKIHLAIEKIVNGERVFEINLPDGTTVLTHTL